ncbi:hypothetical protein AGMMS49944_31050 [Spirochaetia bacterium]|nr:hypothetical protein AGMMS49944_31050 [Spirochaetia bacterium]
MASMTELNKMSYFYPQKTNSDRGYRDYNIQRAAVMDLSNAMTRNTMVQIAANTFNSERLNQTMVKMNDGFQIAMRQQSDSIIASNRMVESSLDQVGDGINQLGGAMNVMIASQNALAELCGEGFDRLTGTINLGLTGVSKQLGYMTASYEAGVALQIDAIKNLSEDICSKFDIIQKVLENPLLTQARELYRRAVGNYNKGFYEEALDDLKVSIEKNTTDYLSWFLAGKAYLFGINEYGNVIDLSGNYYLNQFIMFKSAIRYYLDVLGNY